MNNAKNICKFVSTEINENISIHNFVYEKIANNTNVLIAQSYHAIYFVTSGSGELINEKCTKKISAGNIFFTFQQIPFRINNTNNIQYMYISFSGNRADDLFLRFGISPENNLFEGHEGLSAFWENSIVKAVEKNLDLISESVLLYTLGEMVPPEINEEEHLINNILKFVEENFKDNELNLNTVSNHFGYSSKYVSRIFKNIMSINFSAYLTNIRIQYAVFLIGQNVTSVKNIALLSGYKDPLYFSNVFKAKLGLSPKEYIAKKTSQG